MWKLFIAGVPFIIMTNSYKILEIFTTNECNLSCNYCYEKDCKSKMEQINHPQDYSIYINKLLDLNQNNKNTLEVIELCGGEPLIHIEEFINYIPQFFSNFTNLHIIKFSSNFTLNNSTENVINLAKALPDNCTIDLQISLDGFEKLNDYNRGKGSMQKTLIQLQSLLQSYNENNQLNIITNPTLNYNSMYFMSCYEDIEKWFNFYLNNFTNQNKNINLKFGFFKLAKLSDKMIKEEDGDQFANILKWADQWKINYPEESKQFIWPIYKINQLKLCAAGVPNGVIALSPSGKLCFCHKAVLNSEYLYDHINKDTKNINIKSAINLSEIYDAITQQYKYYSEFISLQDFKDSLSIYVNLNFCPYEQIYGINLFYINMPLYYRGAMNIYLKWSKENGLD